MRAPSFFAVSAAIGTHSTEGRVLIRWSMQSASNSHPDEGRDIRSFTTDISFWKLLSSEA